MGRAVRLCLPIGLQAEVVEGPVDIRHIRTDSDHRDALLEVATLMASDPALGTPEGDRLDVLVTLIQDYETRHFPIDRPGTVDALPASEIGAGVRHEQPVADRTNRQMEN
jgi:HTH-type transcriptional regulator/antitoxin HigA